jgi:hypothetical protein
MLLGCFCLLACSHEHLSPTPTALWNWRLGAGGEKNALPAAGLSCLQQPVAANVKGPDLALQTAHAHLRMLICVHA